MKEFIPRLQKQVPVFARYIKNTLQIVRFEALLFRQLNRRQPDLRFAAISASHECVAGSSMSEP